MPSLTLNVTWGAEMVPEVLADAGEMTNDGYAKLLQLVLRADA
jgi:hypothetical protein